MGRLPHQWVHHRHTARSILLCALAVLVCSACQQPPVFNVALPWRPALLLEASSTSIPADFASTAKLTVTALATNGDPPTGRVFLTTNQGRFVGSRVGANGKSAVVDLFTTSSGSAQLQCTHDPGPMRITATSDSGGDLGDLVSNTVEVTCTHVDDRSALTFTNPHDGDAISPPYFQDVHLAVQDFHGGLAQAPAVVHVESLDGLGLARVAPQDNRLLRATSVDVPVRAGEAVLWMQSPSASRQRGIVFPARLLASFTNLSGATISTPWHISWFPSEEADRTAVPFTLLLRATGGAVVLRQFQVPRVLMRAGMADAWVDYQVAVINWDGSPWGSSQQVTITCVPDARDGAAGVENCKGLKGRDPALGGTAQVDHASQVVVTAAQPVEGGAGTVAVVRYEAPATSTPGTVRLVASFTPPSGSVVTSTPAETPVVGLVDVNSLTVWQDVFPVVGEGQAREVVLQAYDALSPAEGFLVCASLDDVGAVAASLDDGGDDVGGAAVVMRTNGTGGASFQVRPRPASGAREARVKVTVARVPYTLELDDNTLTPQEHACDQLGDATVVTGSQTFSFVDP